VVQHLKEFLRLTDEEPAVLATAWMRSPPSAASSVSVRGTAVCRPWASVGMAGSKVSPKSGFLVRLRYRAYHVVSTVSWVRLVSQPKRLFDPVYSAYCTQEQRIAPGERAVPCGPGARGEDGAGGPQRFEERTLLAMIHERPYFYFSLPQEYFSPPT
jgi:hypothetical protein